MSTKQNKTKHLVNKLNFLLFLWKNNTTVLRSCLSTGPKSYMYLKCWEKCTFCQCYWWAIISLVTWTYPRLIFFRFGLSPPSCFLPNGFEHWSALPYLTPHLKGHMFHQLYLYHQVFKTIRQKTLFKNSYFYTYRHINSWVSTAQTLVEPPLHS